MFVSGNDGLFIIVHDNPASIKKTILSGLPFFVKECERNNLDYTLKYSETARVGFRLNEGMSIERYAEKVLGRKRRVKKHNRRKLGGNE